MHYVAFLRGINLGKRQVKMDELRKVLKKLGYPDAQTLIASGNVLLQADDTPDTGKLEAGLEKHFGFHIGIIIRSVDELRALIASDPFNGVEHNDDQHLFVTFASGPIGKRLDDIKPVKGVFDIPRVDENQFFIIGYRQENGRYSEFGVDIEKPFRDMIVTNRTWATVQRMVAKAEKS